MDTTPLPATATARIGALRTAMAAAGVDGYLIPRSDEHQAEYVPAFAERLQWLTGFTGSAGMAVVLADRAAIFIDGRYTLQVRDQVDGALYEYRHLIDEPPPAWLAKNLRTGKKLGFDPKLHTPGGLARLEEACARIAAKLVPVDGNLIDKIWTNQPAHPKAPISVYPDAFAGRTAQDKRAQIAGLLKADGLDAFVISALDSLAWLFNIRGTDVEFSPLVLGYAVLDADGHATLCVDPAKITPEVHTHLGPHVSTAAYDAIDQVLRALPAAIKTVGLDRDSASRWLHDRVAAAGRVAKSVTDPITLVKARKHAAELAGVRQAHIRDGAAVVRFLAWLAAEAPKGMLTEISAADQLAAFRAEDNLFRGPSFPTIAGAAGNGAIVHYRATPESNAAIRPHMVLLLDSGGQYLDGTTDITRTVAIGTPTAEQRHRFTLVLKGHIALATARFVKGTTGSQLDVLARHPLWQEGLDFDHGTGHGVGTFLGVHEGPQRIGKMGNTVALEPGMLISNEPGYYKTGAYGIRIENLVIVREAAVPSGGEKPLYEFETITLAPIDRAMIEPSLLTTTERAWLDAYHARVRDTLSPLVDAPTGIWLEQATAPLGS
ncbi:MAG: aminopeptidase P family protein [Rhodospirillaceae bacterium]|nr:MAG: aminopeptidase P family protein [Rhodospirillaceae bacterium]